MLQSRPTAIPEIKEIQLPRHKDARGFFSETYNAKVWGQAGINTVFVQDNHSYSADRHVVRGLHFQSHPFAQVKLVRVARGSVLDISVDIRLGSPTYGKHVAVVLSAEAWNAVYVPVGFAHGFCTLEPHSEVVYKVDQHWVPEHDKGLLWNDPALGIAWPAGADDCILSDRDRKHPALADLPHYFP
jgi:dTDP-4-dehydrorhamnose 3,5-epimerase